MHVQASSCKIRDVISHGQQNLFFQTKSSRLCPLSTMALAKKKPRLQNWGSSRHKGKGSWSKSGLCPPTPAPFQQNLVSEEHFSQIGGHRWRCGNLEPKTWIIGTKWPLPLHRRCAHKFCGGCFCIANNFVALARCCGEVLDDVAGRVGLSFGLFLVNLQLPLVTSWANAPPIFG